MTPTWTYEVDGDDLVVRNVYATCFGGKFDKGDNGQTESGFPNDGRFPWFMGVSLPIRSTEQATEVSPIAFKGPHIPWFTPVSVWSGPVEPGNAATGGEAEDPLIVPLIDNGPDVFKFPTHALDMNPPLAEIFAPTGITPIELANDWSTGGMSFRVIGGAKWVS